MIRRMKRLAKHRDATANAQGRYTMVQRAEFRARLSRAITTFITSLSEGPFTSAQLRYFAPPDRSPRYVGVALLPGGTWQEMGRWEGPQP